MGAKDLEAFRDDLAAVLDGDPAALERHEETLVADEAARDLRHDAERLVRELRGLGASFVETPASELAARVRAAIDLRAIPAPTQEVAPAPAPDPRDGLPAPSPARAPDSVVSGVRPAAAATPKVAPRAPARTTDPVPSRRAPLIVAAVVGTLAAAAAVVVAVTDDGDEASQARDTRGDATTPGWSGRVEAIVRAAAPGGATGVSVRRGEPGEWLPAKNGAAVARASSVRTDARTRARLRLADGTTVTLDHDTELSLSGATARRARLVRGSLLAEVRPAAEVGGTPAVIDVPHGVVTVLGTRLSVTVGPDQTSVRVVYGHARVSDASGRSADVKTGMEGTIGESGVAASQASHLAESTEWAELSATSEGAPDVAVHGLGELRARRPGARADVEQALRLASHRVTVRIQGNVARTEIEEEFANDSPQTLEGTYRFPLPPNAQIARLALYVGDRLEEGAFVDRERAANIWRGVIRQATPTAQRRQTEEYVWVPGPWEDPALLEWQRGGRFELRIFPIPARGSRKVILAYTQVLAPQSDGSRRYVYPLPHDPGGTTRAGRFDVDVRVSGHDPREPVRAHGYPMQPTTSESAATLRLSQAGFVPAGDLVVEYALPRRDAELRAFSYVPPAAAVAATTAGTAGARADDSTTSAALAAAREADRSAPGFVLLAIRPTLPAWRDARPRDYAFVVDVSHSMRGERMARATALLSAIVGTMDRRDRFTVLACDVSCRRLSAGLRSPSAATASEARTFLESIEAGNASDPVAAARAAVAALAGSPGDDRDRRIVMLSDGHATAGWRQPAHVAFAAGQALGPRTTLTTVGIGSDSDEQVMRALARAGGGRFVPYVPGQRVSGAAIAVLESTYGTLLREARVELPSGMTQVAPSVLPTVRAGDELLVVARTRGDVRGEVRLSGKVGQDDWSDRYPVELRMTSNDGNAFLPRLWAAARIEDLDAHDGGGSRDAIAYLSERYGVLSRHTSLLVLESPAMFRAFRVNRVAPVVDWTGEAAAEVSESRALDTPGDATDATSGYGQRAQHGEGESAQLAREIDRRAAVLGGADGGGGGSGRGTAGTGTTARGPAPPVVTRRTMVLETEESPDEEAARPSPPAEPDAPAPGATTQAAPPPPPRRPRSDARPNAERADVAATPPRTPNDPAAVVTAQGEADRAQMRWFPLPAARPAMPTRRRSGTWMRRVTVRVGEVRGGSAPGPAALDSVERARQSLALDQNSRDRHRNLVRALAISGDVDAAADVATRWWERDRLDTEALARLSDAEARRGYRERAIRLVASTLDVRGDDVALHERMARLYERVARSEEACAHRIALAEIQRTRAETLGAALGCLRRLGRDAEATHLAASITDGATRTRAEAAAAATPAVENVRGDVVVEATWDAPVDLDISVITPRGTRASWMGGLGTITARDATTPSRESVGVSRAGTGRYVIEIARPDASAASAVPISGRVTVRVLGERRTLPFTLVGQRLVLGHGVIRTESRMVSATW
ncbi:MAG: FecR domain-containing protein [Deltaproteobacteria bacterium]|nr:FecR domain-containing protein [Deltaproteobacteria bacterium]